MDINIISAVSAMGAINGFLIAIFIYIRGKKNMVRLPLIIYIAILSTYILGIAIKYLHASDFIFRCIYFNDILYGMLIYMYIRNKIANRFIFYKKDFLYIIPIFLVYTGAEFLFLQNGSVVLKWIIELVVDIVFVLLALKLLTSHIKKQEAIIQNRNWKRLKGLIVICLTIDIIESVIFVLYLIENLDIYLYLYLNILYAVAIYVIGYNEIFSLTTTKDVKLPAIVSKSNIQERLLLLMKTDRPYLNNEIKISDIAKLLGEKIATISNVINNDMGQNFSDFINSYRVAEAKKMLSEKNDKLSIEGIGYEVGFKAKTTFYASFKKFTGKTPTKY